jgi:AIPR protein
MGTRVVKDLQSAKAYPRVDATLVLRLWDSQQEPLQTYFGFVSLVDLAKLYQKHGLALYAKNLRNPLGHTTEVAKAVRETLETRPNYFVYFNNGVTALCERIDPKDNKKAGKRLNLTGMSVINGAQTIAVAAHFMAENPEHDISGADVLITVIRADSDNEFGKSVTRHATTKTKSRSRILLRWTTSRKDCAGI